MSKAFTPRAVDALRPVMRAVTHELIDRFAAHGEYEFMVAFADPYPSRIICELLGILRERFLAVRLRASELAGSVPWRPAMGIRGPVTLPIRFRVAV